MKPREESGAARIVAILGSTTRPSRTARVLEQLADGLRARGHVVTTIAIRDLPAMELLTATVKHPVLAAAIAEVGRADALVLATPIYKASFTGGLKAFLDILPQRAFREKVVLPIATAGTLAHMLAMDYGLRPVLMSLGAAHVAASHVVLDTALSKTERGVYELAPEAVSKLEEIAAQFANVLASGASPIGRQVLRTSSRLDEVRASEEPRSPS